MKNTPLKNIEFKLATAHGSKVSVAGTFNDWDPEKNHMNEKHGSGLYKTVIVLPPGKHEYKFVVNGEWRTDPNCLDQVTNCHDSLNSVIHI